VYNLRLEFLQPFLRWSTLAFVLAFNFVIQPAAAKTRSTTVLFCFSLSGASGLESRGGCSFSLRSVSGSSKSDDARLPVDVFRTVRRVRPPYIRFSPLFSVRSRVFFFCTAVYLVLELTTATQTGSRAPSVPFPSQGMGTGDRLFLFLPRSSNRGDGAIPSSLIYFHQGHGWEVL